MAFVLKSSKTGYYVSEVRTRQHHDGEHPVRVDGPNEVVTSSKDQSAAVRWPHLHDVILFLQRASACYPSIAYYYPYPEYSIVELYRDPEPATYSERVIA
jgi:hypothetical protein